MKISSYYLSMIFSFLAMGYLMLRRRRRFGLKMWQACVFALLLSVICVAGSKLLYVLESIQETIENGFPLDGGFSMFGGIYGAALLSIPIGLLFRLNPEDSMDYCAPCAVLALALLRVGCYLNGCCGGWEATFFGYRFHWPTQIIESLGNFVLFGFLSSLERMKKYKGQLGAVSLIGYGLLRFIVEFLRDTPKNWFFLSHGQWFAIISVILGLTIRRIVQNKKEKSDDSVYSS